MVVETFVLKKAVEMSGVTIFKSIKFGLIFLAVAGIIYCCYCTIIQPHTKARIATKTENIQQKIEYNYPEDKNFFLGIKLFGFKLGVSR